MDAYQVPKKINRHVLKAVNVLKDGDDNLDSVATSQIIEQVKYQMRNLLPVKNIDAVIRKSLKNLVDVGLINRSEAETFTIDNNNSTNSNMFKPYGLRKRSIRQIHPNSERTKVCSDDSLSGDDYDRIRKRMRTNNKTLTRAGRETPLPKVKKYRFSALPKSVIKITPADMMHCNSNSVVDHKEINEIFHNSDMSIFQPSTEAIPGAKKFNKQNCSEIDVSIANSLKNHQSKESVDLNQPTVQKSNESI